MATGKTLGKYSKIYIDGYDISGDSNAWNVGLTFPEAGLTTVASTQGEYLCEIPKVSGEVKTWLNATASTGSFDRLKTPATRNLCIALGIMAVPAVGDPAFCAQVSQMDVRAETVLNSAVKADAKFSGAGPATSQVNNIYGVVLHANAQETATTTSTSVNNGAASTAGALCFLQVTAAGGSWAFTVEDSANNSTFATIATFSSNGSAITSEVQAVSGTVRQYVRCVATRTSGNATYFCAIVRGL